MSEWEEMAMWQGRGFLLAPKDHWEVNGILDYLEAWIDLSESDPSILVIFGPSKNRDTWVTEFSLDMVQACKLQGDLVASAMCERPDNQTFTPTTVIKKLICQLLERNSRLIIEALDILNIRTFRRVRGFDHACFLFESLVARLTMSLSLTIIIDRIDCCEVDKLNADECQKLVEFLSGLVRSYPQQRLKVIITSGDDLPEGESLPPELAISTCKIASGRRPLRREAIRPARDRTNFFVTPSTHTDSEALAFISTPERVVGLEHLYGMRKSMLNRYTFIGHEGNLVPRTPRQKMICRYFDGLEGIPDGSFRLYDPEDLK